MNRQERPFELGTKNLVTSIDCGAERRLSVAVAPMPAHAPCPVNSHAIRGWSALYACEPNGSRWSGNRREPSAQLVDRPWDYRGARQVSAPRSPGTHVRQRDRGDAARASPRRPSARPPRCARTASRRGGTTLGADDFRRRRLETTTWTFVPRAERADPAHPRRLPASHGRSAADLTGMPAHGCMGFGLSKCRVGGISRCWRNSFTSSRALRRPGCARRWS